MLQGLGFRVSGVVEGLRGVQGLGFRLGFWSVCRGLELRVFVLDFLGFGAQGFERFCECVLKAL